MTGILVSVAPAMAEGRLVPRYLNRSGILSIACDMSRPAPFGIDIDGDLILDFDESGVLAGVELRLPMRRWKGKGDPSPPGGSPGNLVLAEPRLPSQL